MKFLKRFLITIVILLLSIGIGLTIFLQIRKYTSEKQLVHKHSTSVVKVALDDIIISALWSEIKNGSSFKDDSTRLERESKSWDFGMKIPASLYFFSVNNDFKKIYTYQSLKDKIVFQKALLNIFELDSTAIHMKDDYWWIGSSDNKMKCIGDDTNVLFSINLSSGDYFGELEEMWTQRTNLLEVPARVDALNDIRFNEDLVYVDLKNKNSFSLNLEEGIIEGRAIIQSVKIESNKGNKVRKIDKNAILSAYSNINIKPFLNVLKSYLFWGHQVNDLLNNSFADYVDVQWQPKDVMQKDTVISYDYDENFEAIMKEDIREVNVPNLQITIKGSKDLYHFMPNKMYYKFSKSMQEGYIILRTAGIEYDSLDFESTNNFMELHYSYDESLAKYFSKFPQLSEIRNISITGKTAENVHTVFSFEIKLMNSNMHPVTLLY